ncbi:MAG: hypothetical protein AAGF87_02765 [Bacteroidota bacterium]
MNIRQIAFSVFVLLSALPVSAQQFGRNKPSYESFDFQRYQSPNFELYTYIDNQQWLIDFLNDAEEWYTVHQFLLQDSIAFRNPLIIYGNHPDFQQTNTISGAIGIGTGGVTEAFKNRVIMPVAMTGPQTHHVLGHELVHAFQYDMVIRGDSTDIRSLGNLPLWMVEGMAEYLSIGGVDPFTAMWMRDAVLNNKVPSIRDLSRGNYFPYRYGQAFWSFVTGLKGDDVINPYFRLSARVGVEEATQAIFGYPLDTLSNLWQDAIRRDFGKYVNEEKEERYIGRPLVEPDREGGRINIAPEISPNGRYLIFLSERDLFNIDLFLADARTGEIIRKIKTTRRGGHVDAINYIENSGTWSPNGREFAYTVVSKGDNKLIIADVQRGRSEREIKPEGLPAFSNPAWSPDGRSIVVVGLVEGQTDLYSINVRNGAVTQLTDDIYSEVHPSWSADGSSLYFSTDQLAITSGNRSHGANRFNLAKLDIASSEITNWNVFLGADNLNPIEASDGSIVFLSNRDGFRNIYRYDPYRAELTQLTDLITGVSGITQYAPAISIDRRNDRLLYTYFNQRGYKIYQAMPEDLLAIPVSPDDVDLSPATLLRLNPRATMAVDPILQAMDQEPILSEAEVSELPYEPQFKLDYVGGGVGAGVGTNQIFGTTAGLAGGVDLLFSDILGNAQFFTSLQLNGEITDFGGTIAYINRKKRIQYGFSIGRIPFRSFGTLNPFLDSLEIAPGENAPVINSPFLINRLFQNQVGAFAQLPFTTNLRLEGRVDFSLYNNRVDQVNRYFSEDGSVYLGQIGRPERRRDLEQESFSLVRGGLALIGDNSSFGLTAPLRGHRFRLGVDRYLGTFDFTAANLDFRRYIPLGKGAFAFRVLHQGRYGGNSDNLFPLYLGNPWFVRGGNSNELVDALSRNDRDIEELIGSKLIVTNAEFRIPFTGPERLALIKSGAFFSDLNFFIDGGWAFYDFSQFGGPEFTLGADGEPLINPITGEPFLTRAEAKPLFTAGVSLRVNLFGALIVEPYYARPLLQDADFRFGINIIPGW